MGSQTQFQRPTLIELIDRVTDDVSSRMTGDTGAVLRHSALGIIARAQAGAAHLLHGHLDWIANQVIIDTAEAEWLERWASIWKVTRKPAAFAGGSVTFTGTDGKQIPAGSVVVRSDGVEFTTDADGTISGGTVAVAITASVADTDEISGNTSAATVLTLQTPIVGVNSSVTVGAGGIVNGAAQESDDDLRARLLFRIQNPPRGGHLNDYIAWALEVAGVTRAWSYAHYTAVGKVGVTFVLDNEVDIIPDQAKLDEVEAWIDTKRPATVKGLVVFAPTETSIDMTITLTPNTAAVQAAVEAEISDFFSRWDEPGAAILMSQLNEAISLATGETDHTIDSTTPAAASNKITLAANALPKLGTITWA